MGVGKTAFLPKIAGKGSAAVRRSIVDMGSHILVVGARAVDPVYLKIGTRYTHMGRCIMASLSQLPELTARHASTRPYVDRLSYSFFKKTNVEVKKKLDVAASLLLSKELYCAGAMPLLAAKERTKLHANVMSVYRRACSEGYFDDPNAEWCLSDLELLKVYNLRAPMTVVRFARLRMSVRLLLRAPLELIVLVFHAGNDTQSWLFALRDDLKWMALCQKDASFSLLEWCVFARANPKGARNLVRKVCSSAGAQSLTVAENKPKLMAMIGSFTCYCGQAFKSKAALDGHRGTFHRELHPVQHYAHEQNTCLTCLVKFSNRDLLCTHLSRGYGTCWLNMVLKVPPLSVKAVRDMLKDERIHTNAREVAGLPQNLAEIPAFRVPGPLLVIHGFDGSIIPTTSNLHPFGPQKRKYLPAALDDEYNYAVDEDVIV